MPQQLGHSQDQREDQWERRDYWQRDVVREAGETEREGSTKWEEGVLEGEGRGIPRELPGCPAACALAANCRFFLRGGTSVECNRLSSGDENYGTDRLECDVGPGVNGTVQS